MRVLNSVIATGSLVFVTPTSIDATLGTWSVTQGSGFFDVSGSAAATAAWSFNWFVVN